jgi:plasmid stabilization system protein ParE
MIATSRLRSAASAHEIADYLRPRNPFAAQRVRDSILDSLTMLTRFPLVGRRQTIEGVRKLVTRKYRYIVYYTVDEGSEEIIILSIQHPARASDYDDL